MFVKEEAIRRRDVEAKLTQVGDYVKMDYLQACLKKTIDFDTKKYVLTTLADIYETKKMFLEAAKMLRMAAEINATAASKMQDYLRSMTLSVKGGNFAEAEISYTKAVACAEGIQKERVKAHRKEAFRKQAEELVAKDRRKGAAEAYERLLSLELFPDERKAAQTALLRLYEQLGKITEYNGLKHSMGSPSMPSAQQRAALTSAKLVSDEEIESKSFDRPQKSFSFREIGLDD